MHFIFVPPAFFILIGSIPADGDTSALLHESSLAAMTDTDLPEATQDREERLATRALLR